MRRRNAGHDIWYGRRTTDVGRATVAAVLVEPLERRTLLAAGAFAGAPDIAFGTGGRATSGVPVSRDDVPAAVAVADGKVLVGGLTRSFDQEDDSALARFDARGRPDPTFGGDGTTSLDVASQPSGYETNRVVAVIGLSGGRTLVQAADGTLARFAADGTLDPTFGTGGRVTDAGTTSSFGGLFVLADGAMLVHSGLGLRRVSADGRVDAGFGGGAGVVEAYAAAALPDGRAFILRFGTLLRLRADGTEDPSFAPIDTGLTAAAAVVAAPGGKALVGGTSESVNYDGPEWASPPMLLKRYAADGSPDHAFGRAGVVTTAVNAYYLPSAGASSPFLRFVAAADGRVTVFGQRSGELTLVRYAADGMLDASYRAPVLPDAANTINDPPASFAVAADGSAYVAYAGGDFAAGDFAVVRYEPDGRRDTAFGGGGVATADFESDRAGATAAAAGPGGTTLVVGYAGFSAFEADEQFVLRLRADGSPDPAFGGGDGKADLPFAPFDVAAAPGGKVLVAGIPPIADGTREDRLLIARLNADGTPDRSFGTNGTYAGPLGSGDQFQLRQLLVGADGRAVAAGSFGLLRLTAAGRADASFGRAGFVRPSAGFELADAALSAGVRVVLAGLTDLRYEPDEFGDLIAFGRFAAMRFKPDGTPDPTFGKAGRASIGPASGVLNPAVAGVATLADGGVLIGGDSGGGYFRTGFTLARFDAAGRPAAGFGTGGLARTEFGTGTFREGVGAFAATPDGTGLFAAAYNPTGIVDGPIRAVVVRFAADGTLDPSFGPSGAKADLGRSGSGVVAVLPHPDGRVTVVGTAAAPGVSQVAAVRFVADAPGRPVDTGLARPVADLVPGAGGSTPTGMTPLGGGRVAFFAQPGDDPFELGLYLTDGTTAGTRRVGGRTFGFLRGSVTVDGVAFFLDETPAGGARLWRTDGTAAGTRFVKAIPGGGELVAAGSTVYVRAGGDIDGPPLDLWASDGTPAGTRLVRRFAGGFQLYDAVAYRGRLYFVADNGVHGSELWTSDGTPAGTRMVKDVRPGFQNGSFPGGMTVIDGWLYFAAKESEYGNAQVWRTNGLTAATRRLTDMPASALAGFVSTAFVRGGDGQIYFPALVAAGVELWVTDPTVPAGARPIRIVHPTTNGVGAGELVHLFALGRHVYFSADDGVHGSELWRTDGSAAGTTIVRDINPGPGSAFDVNAFGRPATVRFGGRWYFVADDGRHGPELWRTDGTAAGTTLVGDVNPGIDGSHILSLVSTADGRLLFDGYDDLRGTELWATGRR